MVAKGGGLWAAVALGVAAEVCGGEREREREWVMEEERAKGRERRWRVVVTHSGGGRRRREEAGGDGWEAAVGLGKGVDTGMGGAVGG